MVPHLRQRFSRCSSLLVPWALLIFSSKCFTVIEVKTWLIGTGLVITIYTTLFICTTIISTTHRQMRSHKEPCLIHLCYMLWGKTTLSFLCKNNPNSFQKKLSWMAIVGWYFMRGFSNTVSKVWVDHLISQNEIWNAKIGFCREQSGVGGAFDKFF